MLAPTLLLAGIALLMVFGRDWFGPELTLL